MANNQPIYMATTEIPMERTAAEITSCLVQAGATSVSTTYQAGKIVGLTWSMRVLGNEANFAMPARVAPIYKLLCKRRSPDRGDKWFADDLKTKLHEQAERVAWRQLLRWVQAQLAMIETGMVQSGEVFMPYMQHADGRTFFEYFESQQLRLTAGETKPS